MSKLGLVGQLSVFDDSNEEFSLYVERLEQYFLANDIDQAKRVPVLISVLGPKTYKLLRNLLTPQLPKDSTYDDLIKKLQDHFRPAPITIAERFRFHRRNQNDRESISDYIVDLKRLASTCDFGTFLPEALRDRFVCGIRCEATQKRLLAKKDLKLDDACEIALAMELAEQGASNIKVAVPVLSSVNKVNKVQSDITDLIGMVNKLQDKFSSCGNYLKIPLPQIVVVGGQSAGKSSTLENIVGREFLPRGTETVTRRPTVVQLLPCDEEYATFLHKPGVRFTNFEDVKNEISEETNRNPGPVGFSSEPISLRIYSPEVLKLTLVDLPGLIKVIVGDQPEDSIQKIRDMVLEYISQPNSLILAVTPANSDIASSDALEIAKMVDPQRVRTIGVLTKLDIMDKGTDAREVLENKKIPLARGYVGVLNRSQEDIKEGRDIPYCLDKEERFFSTMPCYQGTQKKSVTVLSLYNDSWDVRFKIGDMADRMGTKYLRKSLAEQLYVHIKEYLPIVRKELSQKLNNARKELKEISENVDFDVNDPSSIQDYMIKLTQKFIENLQDEILGYSVLVSMEELSAGTMINYKLNKSIQNFKLPQVPAQRKLLTILANSGGVRNCFTMASSSLETAFYQLLSMYIDPLNLLVDDIAAVLDSSAEKSSKVLSYFPSFKNEVIFLIRNAISEAADETKETLGKHLQAEMYSVNTSHKDFTFPDFEASESLFPIKLWQNSGNSSGVSCSGSSSGNDCGYSDNGSVERDSDQLEAIESIERDKAAKANADVLAKTIENYITIQQKRIEDVAFKYILFFLVKRVMDFVKSDLLRRVLNSVDKEIICRDCEKEFNRMNVLESTCECLEDALKAVLTF